MPTLPLARVRAAFAGVLAVAGLTAFSSAPAAAQVADGDILADSELARAEEAGSGLLLVRDRRGVRPPSSPADRQRRASGPGT